MLPRELVPYNAVYYYERKLKSIGLIEGAHDLLRKTIREQAEKKENSSLGLINSHSVETSRKGVSRHYIEIKKERKYLNRYLKHYLS